MHYRPTRIHQTCVRACYSPRHCILALVLAVEEDVSPHMTKGVKTSCRDALRADSETSGWIQPTPSEGLQSWHYDTLTSLASYYRTKALPSDYGPTGLLEQGQRLRIRQSRRSVLRDYRPKEAASSRSRAVCTTGPVQGPQADREQRTQQSTFLCSSTLQGTTGRDGSAGLLCRSTLQQEDDMTTRPPGSGQTSPS